MGDRGYYYLNRTLCDVLEEMRKCYETRNFAPLLGLIEEAQSMGNRMEAALSDQKDLVKMHVEWEETRKKIDKLHKEYFVLLEKYESVRLEEGSNNE